MLAMSLIIVILGYAGYRLLTRGERGAGVAALRDKRRGLAGLRSPACAVGPAIARPTAHGDGRDGQAYILVAAARAARMTAASAGVAAVVRPGVLQQA